MGLGTLAFGRYYEVTHLEGHGFSKEGYKATIRGATRVL